MASFQKFGLTYTYQPAWNLVSLRKRIIKIAASYVGQREITPNQGWEDSGFETKMKNVGWPKGKEWCNLFCRLVYAEAFYGGNAIPSLSGPSAYNNVNNFFKSSTGKYRTSLKGQNKGGDYYGANRGAVDSTVGYTSHNHKFDFKNFGNRMIDLAGPGVNTKAKIQGTLQSSYISIYKNITKKQELLDSFISAKAVLPGDLLIFDWGGDLRGGGGESAFAGAQHVGIYLGGRRVIDGNGSYNGKEMVKPPHNVDIQNIRGIVQLTVIEGDVNL